MSRGGTVRDPLLSSPPCALREMSSLNTQHFLLQHIQGRPSYRPLAPPCPPPRVQQSQTATGARGAREAPPEFATSLTEPWSTRLPLLAAAVPGCSSPAKQSHRKQRQFHTGKCFERGRLGETSLSSSEESISQSLSSLEEARCGSRCQGCLLAVTSHLQGTGLQRLAETR